MPRPACAIVVGAPLCLYTFLGTYAALCASFASSHAPSTSPQSRSCSTAAAWFIALYLDQSGSDPADHGLAKAPAVPSSDSTLFVHGCAKVVVSDDEEDDDEDDDGEEDAPRVSADAAARAFFRAFFIARPATGASPLFRWTPAAPLPGLGSGPTDLTSPDRTPSSPATTGSTLSLSNPLGSADVGTRCVGGVYIVVTRENARRFASSSADQTSFAVASMSTTRTVSHPGALASTASRMRWCSSG
mmetsp:Transcript_7264/g.33182  ORF Transcript_7264/g.33182 Transcript_7264/m.33182 type:complete len:245 (-) Transcript_7264:771-1505(-)